RPKTGKKNICNRRIVTRAGLKPYYLQIRPQHHVGWESSARISQFGTVVLKLVNNSAVFCIWYGQDWIVEPVPINPALHIPLTWRLSSLILQQYLDESNMNALIGRFAHCLSQETLTRLNVARFTPHRTVIENHKLAIEFVERYLIPKLVD